MATEIGSLLHDPATLFADDFTLAELYRIMDIRKAKKSKPASRDNYFKIFMDWATSTWVKPPAENADKPTNPLCIDPTTFTVNFPFRLSKELRTACTQRGIPTTSRTTVQDFYVALKEWVDNPTSNLKHAVVPVNLGGGAPMRIDLPEDASTAVAEVENIPLAQSDGAPKRKKMRLGITSTTIGSTSSLTPQVDHAFNALFKAFFNDFADSKNDDPLTSSLVIMEAREARMGTIVFLYVDKVDDERGGAIHLYEVEGVTLSGIKLRRLSTLDTSESDLPTQEGKIAPTTNILALSADCFAKFTESEASSLHGFKANFGTGAVAATPKKIRGNPQPRVVINVDDTYSTNMSSTMPDTRLPSTSSAQDLATVISGVSHDNATRSKTPRAVLNDAQATILAGSKAADMLKTGNITNYRTLMWVGESTDETYGVFWELQRFRCQIQPWHLVQMTVLPTSVDIRLFADTYSTYGRFHSTKIMEDYMLCDSALDTKRILDLDLVGYQFSRFRTMVTNFACAMDVLLRFAPRIRHSIREALERIVDYGLARALDPIDPSTPMLFLYWAHSFQRVISQMYERVHKLVWYSCPVS